VGFFPNDGFENLKLAYNILRTALLGYHYLLHTKYGILGPFLSIYLLISHRLFLSQLD
jgi:hypothetical protein